MGIRILLQEVLRAEGYEVLEAGNGLAGLSMAAEEKPDLILLDMKLPGMDGLEILKQLNQTGNQARVIMMTAYGELDLIQQATALGSHGHFTKPFDLDDLRAMVKAQMENKLSQKQQQTVVF
jgi:two-component system response regulator (stage 0 sporulation protein F)